MRFLLDEDIDTRLADVLRALGHDADHIAADLNRPGIDDMEVADLAGAYDALITIDLHRQDREWIAVNEAMLAATRVVRMRFAGSERTELVDQARILLQRWREWTHRITVEDARLVTLSGMGGKVRSLNSDEVRELLEGRQRR